MNISILIATYNRARDLERTLESLADVVAPPNAALELLVIDNNSTDDTRAVVERAATAFPYPLRYEFEPQQGRSAALNRGFRCAAGDVIITTDDDVRVPADWVVQVARAFEQHDCGYIAGRVLPVWGATPPEWLSREGGRMWAVIALLDYGPSPIELTNRVPLGVNMAIRREALDRVGGFNARIGRKAGTLLGQEVREWGLRARAASVRGMYVPEVVLQHLIPADRLNKAYFRRWFYWRGISRAMMYAETGRDMEHPETSTLDFSTVPHVLGVPRYMFRTAMKTIRSVVTNALRGQAAASFEDELWLWFFAGILRQRWNDYVSSGQRHHPNVQPGAAAR